MSVRAAGLGSARNGLLPEEWKPYVYRGTGVDVLEVPKPPPARSRRKGQPRLPERITAALESLGGEASTTQIRVALELDGGPAFTPGYLGLSLGRLARRDPPLVTRAGRECCGVGRPARWHLGPGARTAERPAASARRGEVGSVPNAAPADRESPGGLTGARCAVCGYLRSAPGHRIACGDSP